MDEEEAAMLAAAIELSLREAAAGGRGESLPDETRTDQSSPPAASAAGGTGQDAGFSSLLASLQQAMATATAQQPAAHEGSKMVLCVRRDLAMTTGKIAAQCSHATLGLYKTMVAHYPRLLQDWEDSHCAKIALKLDDEKQMLALQQKADALGLPTHIVCDAGKTQIARGSRTVLAIAGKKSVVDSVTGELKLL